MILDVEVFKVFLLAMTRISGLLVSAPVLGSANFPATAKVGVSALTAMLVLPAIPELPAPLPDDPVQFAIMGAGELLVGLMMGFVMTIVFAAIQVAGQIMDMLTGFGLINVFNPALETQVPIFGFFFFLIGVLFLLVIDGHHLMLIGIVNTFGRIPLGGLSVHPAVLRDVSTMGRLMFYDGLLIAAPIAGALLVTYLTMGFLGRVVPQIHLFVVGFPVTIAIGLTLAGLMLRAYVDLLDGMYERMFEDVSRLMLRMS